MALLQSLKSTSTNLYNTQIKPIVSGFSDYHPLRDTISQLKEGSFGASFTTPDKITTSTQTSQPNNSTTQSTQYPMGIKPANPDQNIKTASNTISPSQANPTVKAASTSAPINFYKDSKGTYYTTTGIKIPDLATLQQYAKAGGKEVSAPTTITSSVIKPQGEANVASGSIPTMPISTTSSTSSNSGNPATGAVNTTNQGLLTSLASNTLQGSPATNTATTGLLNTAQTNPGTSGQAYDDYQKAVNELNTLKQQIAQQQGGIESQAIPLEFQQGREQVLNRQYASMLDAAQQKVNQAQAALGYQISGVQTQQAGYNQAGGLGNQAQGLTQQGITSALGYTQPVQVQYGTPLVNPQTGQVLGGTGTTGDVSSTINYWANQIATNKASINDVPATITGNIQLKTQLQQAIQGINPSYNPSVQQAGQETASALTAQTNQLQAALNGAEANFKLLTNTAQQGGVNDMNVPVLNTLQQNIARGLASNSSVINFQSTLATVRSQYAAILGGGTVTVDSQNRAQQAIPDNISLSALQSLEQQMKQEAQNRIVGYQTQIQSLTSGASQGSSLYDF